MHSGTFYHVQGRPGEAPVEFALPTAIHSIRKAVTVFEEPPTNFWRFAFEFKKARGCHAITGKSEASSPAQTVPGWNHLCGRRTRRGRRPFTSLFPLSWCCRAGNASISAAILPGRRRPRVDRRARSRNPSRTDQKPRRGASQKPRRRTEKNCHALQEPPADTAVDWSDAGRSPPAPHPQSPGVEPRSL